MTLPTYISSPPTHTLPSAPPPTHVLSSLPPDHVDKYNQAVEYYSDPEYRVGKKGLPSGAVGGVAGVVVGDGEDERLTEDEMIFLVSTAADGLETGSECPKEHADRFMVLCADVVMLLVIGSPKKASSVFSLPRSTISQQLFFVSTNV